MSAAWSDDIPDPEGEKKDATVPELLNFYDIPMPPENDPNELLKHRFLCRGGGMLLIGHTGIGKSAFALQCAILWSLGREAFGIKPTRPLRILIIQAENDAGDMAEFREGILRGVGITEEERRGSVIYTACEDARTAEDFCKLTVKPLLEKAKPDILILDPALAYLGGEANQQADVSAFLRNNLNPLIHEHGCAVIIVHHTNKPPQGEQKGGWQAGDFAYLGSGSAEWANWARAALAIRSLGSYDYFELRATKRGKRLRWTGGELEEPTFTKIIAHSTAGICWREATKEEFEATSSCQETKFNKRKPHMDQFMNIFPRDFSDDPRTGLLSADQIKNIFHDRGWHKDFYKGVCDEAEVTGRIKSTGRGRCNQVLRGLPAIVDAFEARQKEKGSIMEDVPLSAYAKRKSKKKACGR